MWAQASIFLVLAGVLPHLAAAEAGSERPWRGAVAAGGYLAITGPSALGALATAELFPGGAAGRFGVRLEARGFHAGGLGDAPDSGLLTTGVIYEAAAARPRLTLALHAEAGVVVPDARAALGGGVRTQLWLVGPLALGLDTTATLIVDGLDSELALASALTLGLAR
jgi:hypothetical protein